MEDMSCSELQNMLEILDDMFVRGQGTIGFGKNTSFAVLFNTSVLNRGS